MNTETAGNIAVCITAFVAVITAIIAIYSLKVDHKRRKKQATFDFYHNIYKEFRQSLENIETKFPNDQAINVESIEDNKHMFDDICGYLSCMERFSVGIDEDVYDFKVFIRTVGASLTIWWFDKFKEFIPYIRKKYNCPFAYKNLEILVSNLKIEREKNIKQNIN